MDDTKKLMSIKRKLLRAIRNADSAEDLADSLLEIIGDDASEADIEQAATTLAQIIFDCEGGSGGGDRYDDREAA